MVALLNASTHACFCHVAFLNLGVVRLSFHLSSEPVAGSWTVFVYALYSWTIDVSDQWPFIDLLSSLLFAACFDKRGMLCRSGIRYYSVVHLHAPVSNNSLILLVLPKFEVDLLLPEYILSDDQLLSGTVIARLCCISLSFYLCKHLFETRYTYGKPVKGQACLHVTSVHQKFFSYSYSPSKETVCIKVNL